MLLTKNKQTMHKKSDFFSLVKHSILANIYKQAKAFFWMSLKYIKHHWKIISSIAVLCILAVVWITYKQASLPELFSYIPANADQVVINRPARNIQNTQDLWVHRSQNESDLSLNKLNWCLWCRCENDRVISYYS